MSTNAAGYGVTGVVTDGNPCLSPSDCNNLTSNCCLLKDASTVANQYFFCVPSGVKDVATATTITFSTTAYASGTAASAATTLTLPMSYMETCTVRTMAAGANSLAVGASAVLLAATIALN